MATRPASPQKGDTFKVTNHTIGQFANISYIISPVIPNGAIFNLSDAYKRVQKGVLTTVPHESEFFDAMLDAIDADIDTNAEVTSIGGGGTTGANCTSGCAVATWAPGFETWEGNFEPSGVTGSLSVPKEGGGLYGVRCVECGVGIPSFTGGEESGAMSVGVNWAGMGLILLSVLYAGFRR